MQTRTNFPLRMSNVMHKKVCRAARKAEMSMNLWIKHAINEKLMALKAKDPQGRESL